MGYILYPKPYSIYLRGTTYLRVKGFRAVADVRRRAVRNTLQGLRHRAQGVTLLGINSVSILSSMSFRVDPPVL